LDGKSLANRAQTLYVLPIEFRLIDFAHVVRDSAARADNFLSKRRYV